MPQKISGNDAGASFSVLMSVYAGEKPEFLDQSLASLLTSDRSPAEVVLVEDGPLSGQLHSVIGAYRPRLPIKSIRLECNLGLPAALNAGLKHVQHELVGRFDTDDLCLPTRFSEQVQYLESHPEVAAVGTWIEEFDAYSGETLSMRCPPPEHLQLVRYAKQRSPMNHPSVMFRKSAVVHVGGYESDVGLEDYGLWMRLILAGYKIGNIPRVLVRMRAGSAQTRRRRGIAYAFHEFQFVNKYRRIGFFSWLEFLMYILAHTPFRLLPSKQLNWLYQNRLRSRPTSQKAGVTH